MPTFSLRTNQVCLSVTDIYLLCSHFSQREGQNVSWLKTRNRFEGKIMPKVDLNR